MEGGHLLKLVVELLVGVGEELSLGLELLLDVFVNIFLLLLRGTHVVVEVGVERQLELVVVVDVLRYPVDSIAVGADVSVVSADLGPRVRDLLLHLLLAVTVVVHCQTQAGVDLVEELELAVQIIGLFLELQDLVLLGSDIPLQVFDLVVEHKFELLQFLSLLLQ